MSSLPSKDTQALAPTLEPLAPFQAKARHPDRPLELNAQGALQFRPLAASLPQQLRLPRGETAPSSEQAKRLAQIG